MALREQNSSPSVAHDFKSCPASCRFLQSSSSRDDREILLLHQSIARPGTRSWDSLVCIQSCTPCPLFSTHVYLYVWCNVQVFEPYRYTLLHRHTTRMRIYVSICS